MRGKSRLVRIAEEKQEPASVCVHNLNFDNPTHEETLEHQRMADDILLQEEADTLYERHFAMQRMKRDRGKYAAFLREVIARSISMNPFEYADVKKQMLERYFPRQFAKQDLSSYTTAKVGRIFARLVNYSRGR